jgi:predicted enzyme related to lactoylglutathione lyase
MNEVAHFDIPCDDVPRARRFYEKIFDWEFVSYGHAESQDFLQIKTKTGKVIGAVQSRKFDPLDQKVNAWECSIEVADIDRTTRAAEEAGAKVLMRRAAIPYVGWVSKFMDPEGNLFCAVQYDRNAR